MEGERLVELRDVEAQLGRLLQAIKLGGALPSIVSGVKTLERRREALLRPVRPPVVVPGVTMHELRAVLDDWRAMFQQNLVIARQVLRTLLTERVIFTPRLEDGRVCYEMRALCSLDRFSIGYSHHKRWWPQGDSNPR
jgi:hypothetical protein